MSSGGIDNDISKASKVAYHGLSLSEHRSIHDQTISPMSMESGREIDDEGQLSRNKNVSSTFNDTTTLHSAATSSWLISKIMSLENRHPRLCISVLIVTFMSIIMVSLLSHTSNEGIPPRHHHHHHHHLLLGVDFKYRV